MKSVTSGFQVARKPVVSVSTFAPASAPALNNAATAATALVTASVTSMQSPNVRPSVAAPSSTLRCVRPTDRCGHSASYMTPGPPRQGPWILLLLLLLVLLLQPRHQGAVALGALQHPAVVSVPRSGSEGLQCQHLGTSDHAQRGEAIGQQSKIPHTISIAGALDCAKHTPLPAVFAHATSPRQEASVPHPGREPGLRGGHDSDAAASGSTSGSGSGSDSHSDSDSCSRSGDGGACGGRGGDDQQAVGLQISTAAASATSLQSSLSQELKGAVSVQMESLGERSSLLEAKQSGTASPDRAETKVPQQPLIVEAEATTTPEAQDVSLPVEFLSTIDAAGLRRGGQRALHAVGSLAALPLDGISRIAELYGFSSNHMTTTSSSTLEWDRMMSQQATRPPSGGGGVGGVTRPPAGAVPSARDGWFAQAVQNGQREPPSDEVSTAAPGGDGASTVVYTASATSTNSNNGVVITNYSNLITTNAQTIRIPVDSEAQHDLSPPTQGVMTAAARPPPTALPPLPMPQPPLPQRPQFPLVSAAEPPPTLETAASGMANDPISTQQPAVLTFPVIATANANATTTTNAAVAAAGGGSLIVPTAAAAPAVAEAVQPKVWTRHSNLSATTASWALHSAPTRTPPDLPTAVLSPLAAKASLELPESWKHQGGAFGAAAASVYNIQTAATDGSGGSGRVATQPALMLRHVPGYKTALWGQPSPRNTCPHSSGGCPGDGIAVSAHHFDDFLYDMDYVVPDDNLAENALFDPLYRVGVGPLECGAPGTGPLPGMCLAPHAPLLTQLVQPLYDDDYANDFGTAVQATPEAVEGPAGQLDALRVAVILDNHFTPIPWVATVPRPPSSQLASSPSPPQRAAEGSQGPGNLDSKGGARGGSIVLRTGGSAKKGDGSGKVGNDNSGSGGGGGGGNGGNSDGGGGDNLNSRIIFTAIPNLIGVPYPVSIYAGTLYLAEADPTLAAAGRAARAGLLFDYYVQRNYYAAYTFTRFGPSAISTAAATARSRGQIGVAAKARALAQALFNYRRSRYDGNRVEVFINNRALSTSSVGAYLFNNPIVNNQFLLQGPNTGP